MQCELLKVKVVDLHTMRIQKYLINPQGGTIAVSSYGGDGGNGGDGEPDGSDGSSGRSG